MFINSRQLVPTIFEAMAASSVPFTLTGSRFFGTSTEFSDWDFFTEDRDNIFETLIELGFRPKKDFKYTYNDRSLVSVWTHRDQNNNSVDIQIVKDMRLKTIAQTFLLYKMSQPEFQTVPHNRFNANDWNEAFVYAASLPK